MFKKITDYIKSLYPDENPVPLHAPRFLGNEKKYLLDCIDSTFVSYAGQSVCLILGDNIFYGKMDLNKIVKEFKEGAVIFGYYVNDPERYGVVEFNDKGKAISIEEKPA